MSVDANTYEEMTIHNVNDRTAEVARQLGEYLLKTWGIYKLSLTVDGIHYGDDVDSKIYHLHKLSLFIKVFPFFYEHYPIHPQLSFILQSLVDL